MVEFEILTAETAAKGIEVLKKEYFACFEESSKTNL
jgi:hypothetical protein